MNNFLAKTLASINAVVAIIIIALATFSGTEMVSAQGGSSLAGAILGGVVGLIVAALVCGTIALLVMIERHLGVIAASVKKAQ
ncbi:hypothetical protein KX729_14460 [Rhizobium sp. XQZ8]|uniref:hypothetical protein n=1 Tax=Rhizobium populisoli TaxID=2859785 RepID=UPI001CA553E3|nr:hypothetical protein [Rhizobium populisoli]MBW6422658.1 hypothetical protein [Rhizobium populisoli]